MFLQNKITLKSSHLSLLTRPSPQIIVQLWSHFCLNLRIWKQVTRS